MMETDSLNYEKRLEAYKFAFQKLGILLDGVGHGNLHSKGAKIRRQKLDSEIELYGEQSLYKAFDQVYLSGYGVVTPTLNSLGVLNVHTKEDLLEFDIDHAQRYSVDFGERKAEMASHFLEIVKAESELVK